MKTEDIPADAPSPWVPERDLVTLAMLGKLVEELGELTSIAGRRIIQGVDGRDPVTDEPNTGRLREEIADVRASVRLLTDRLSLEGHAMSQRMGRKATFLSAWYAMLGRMK